jgi:hypothetical protein
MERTHYTTDLPIQSVESAPPAGAKLLRENPYPVNVLQVNLQMIERNQVKRAAMQQAIATMRDQLAYD